MALRDGGQLNRTLNLEAKKRRVLELCAARSEDADSALVDLLRDDSWYVRSLASIAIVERGRGLTSDVMAVMATGLWYSRAMAATVLGRMAAIDAAAAVAALLLDANRSVRDAGYDALILLAAAGGERAVALGVRQLDSAVRARFLDDTRQRHPSVAMRIADALDDPAREHDRRDLALQPART